MSESKNPEVEAQELRGEIEQTRAELGDTVDALSQKADVKSQAKAKVTSRPSSTCARSRPRWPAWRPGSPASWCCSG